MNAHLRLHGLSFDSDDEVRLTFVADDGSAEAFVFTINTQHGIDVVSASREFRSLYRQVPGPYLSMWPEKLAIEAWKARNDPLPSGAALAELVTEARQEVERRCQEAQRPSNDTP